MSHKLVARLGTIGGLNFPDVLHPTKAMSLPYPEEWSAVPTWKKADPKHNPFTCSTERHLWRHGLSLAIYMKIGALTHNGDREFFAKIAALSRHFGSNPESTRRAFKLLVSNGWLEATNREGYYKYVPHDARAFFDIDPCVKRELVSWQEDADPFCGHLWATLGGKIRLKPHHLVAIRKYATDAEILAAIKDDKAQVEHRKLQGNYHDSSPVKIFWRVFNHLKQDFLAAKAT